MPSVKNPNKPSKNRLAARAAKIRKAAQKSSAAGRRPGGQVHLPEDQRRGARVGLLPTSGPRKPLSAKKARKLEKKIGYALRRKMEAEGGIMDIETETTEKKKNDSTNEESGGGDNSTKTEEVEMDIS